MTAFPLDGTTISHYRIVSKLGAGGMGEVYLAEDTKLDRKVAIKFLPAESASDQQAKRRLIREARAAAKLDHPNICAIHEVAEEEGRTFIVMQYIEGETLSARLQRQPLELREVLDIAVEVAGAISEAHSHGIIHRDIKPANIMITRRGQAKVLDFGLAKAIPEESLIESQAETQRMVTEPGTIIGTVPYMSPEQVRGESLDARSDIFSFGAVLYETVTGHQPFAAESAAATISAILTRQPAPLARYSAEAPDELRRIVSKALRKDKEERYHLAKDLLIDLRALREQLAFEARLELSTSPDSSDKPEIATGYDPLAVTPAGEPFPTAGQTTSRVAQIVSGTRRHKRAALLALIVLMIVAATAAYFGIGSSKAIDSVAIMPFVNASADPNTDYLSDGITESLISNLSQLTELKVMSRNSVFRYKGREIDPQVLGRELKVAAVLTGRVVPRGDDLVISLELIDVRDSRQLWGEQYQRRLSDVLALQREISREVSEKLRLRLSGNEKQLLARRQTESPEAYQLYLRGRFHVAKFAEDEVRQGIDYFHRALDKDPNYALAYVGLADSYVVLGLDVLPPKEAFPKARAFAERALELDPTLAEAHGSLGLVKFLHDWDWAAAERELQPALGLNPKSVETFSCYLHYKDAIGQPDQAVIEVKQALEKDPLSPSISGEMGCASYYARHYDQTIEQSRQTLDLDPNSLLVRYNLGRAYGQMGMYQEAIAELNRGMIISGGAPMIVAELVYAEAASGNRAVAERLLQKLTEQAERIYVDPYLFAIAKIGLGERDQALTWLGRACEVRSSWIPWVKVEPKFDPLHSDPRFADLLRRVNMVP